MARPARTTNSAVENVRLLKRMAELEGELRFRYILSTSRWHFLRRPTLPLNNLATSAEVEKRTAEARRYKKYKHAYQQQKSKLAKKKHRLIPRPSGERGKAWKLIEVMKLGHDKEEYNSIMVCSLFTRWVSADLRRVLAKRPPLY